MDDISNNDEFVDSILTLYQSYDHPKQNGRGPVELIL
jgi:hypothetical protein